MEKKKETMRILFVCLGNICRSPMAEGLFRDKITKAGLTNYLKTDSVGFEPFHRGDHPDPRAIETCRRHQIDISSHVARLFEVQDFDEYDRIYVMDRGNYNNVSQLARNEKDMLKVDFVMNVVFPGQDKPVPDPWYGDMKDFEHSFKMLDQATDKIMEDLRT
jgi:protein-tyrosine phosphatase